MQTKHPTTDASPAGDVLAPVAAEFFFTQNTHAGETPADVFGRLAADIVAANATVLGLMIYGSVAARAEITSAMVRELGAIQWPITWVEAGCCEGHVLAGVQAFAVSGRSVTRVRLGAEIVGSVFEDGDAKHCLLGGLAPTSLTLQPPAQVQQMFANLNWALAAAGFELRDIVRTWFYNDRILDWYGDFNRVRSAHYADVKWRTGSLPASTGIGARNVARAAVVLAAWAMQPLNATASACEIASPLQCPAPAYGSAFSRAMEVCSGGRRRLFVSGTASIYPDGRTAWVGNAKKQVDLTMEVIAAILGSRGMSFHDVTRATAYFSHPLFKPYFDAWCVSRDLRTMPVVSTHADVCRSDLMFELELDACTAA